MLLALVIVVIWPLEVQAAASGRTQQPGLMRSRLAKRGEKVASRRKRPPGSTEKRMASRRKKELEEKKPRRRLL